MGNDWLEYQQLKALSRKFR